MRQLAEIGARVSLAMYDGVWYGDVVEVGRRQFTVRWNGRPDNGYVFDCNYSLDPDGCFHPGEGNIERVATNDWDDCLELA